MTTVPSVSGFVLARNIHPSGLAPGRGNAPRACSCQGLAQATGTLASRLTCAHIRFASTVPACHTCASMRKWPLSGSLTGAGPWTINSRQVGHCAAGHDSFFGRCFPVEPEPGHEHVGRAKRNALRSGSLADSNSSDLLDRFLLG